VYHLPGLSVDTTPISLFAGASPYRALSGVQGPEKRQKGQRISIDSRRFLTESMSGFNM